jgi:CRISPR-associated protein Cas1
MQGETANPLIPVRMLNEFVYCPRLAYLMWVQGEFEHNEYTVEGKLKHRRVDEGGGVLPESSEAVETIHACSVSLCSEELGITAKMDLVEGEGNVVKPVDYKRGKRPHVAGGLYDPEKVQLCAQGLLLREHGYTCEEGALYFVGSRERVPVAFDQSLKDLTLESIRQFGFVASAGEIPPPLEDSPKCPRCSLMGICLPDEVRFLSGPGVEPRPIIPSDEKGLPLYVQSPRAYVRKDGDRLVIEEEKTAVGHARFNETSQVVLFGSSMLSTPALHECMRREIPVTYLSYGGWFLGHSIGTGHRNVETRTHQYRASFDSGMCVRLARRLVAGKIANCRTMLRRNVREENSVSDELLVGLQSDLKHALRAVALEELLGIEGSSASRYYRRFPDMLKKEDGEGLCFDFETRNRRPPKDPVNAMLSFAYSMLAREWTITLAAVGLDPYRGFYHQPRFGRPALALDMMEPFRPLVADSTVITAINNGEVKPDDFISAAGSCNLTDKGRKRFIGAFERRMNHEVTHPIFKYKISYRRLLEVQARLLIRFLAGEIPAYPTFVTR